MQRKYLHRRGKTIPKPKQLAAMQAVHGIQVVQGMNGINLTVFGEPGK